MRTTVKYWLNYILLTSYALILSSAQFSVLGKLLNSSPDSAISTESSKSQPLDGRLFLAQWNYITTSSHSVFISEATIAHTFIYRCERNEVISLPFTYTTVISHFPYPPFWPRDPSLV